MPASMVNDTNVPLMEDSQESGGMGASLALVGGTLYAVGALIISYATKQQAAGKPGWTGCRMKWWSFCSWCGLNSGGLCVTFAYQSGASVPLMNAIVYSTNLMLNMLLQMAFNLSDYTKQMRCGTLLFALTALLLGDLSPPPHKVNMDYLTRPPAIMWTLVFVCLWAFSAMMVIRVRALPSASSVKIMAWALHIACWGAFTDNWAKINGTFDPAGTMYWVLFLPYVPVGMVVMMLSVAAMAATDVALYVPANLCLQLILNVLSGLFFWNEAERIPSMLSYVVGYVICILAVYISTPEMDLVASFKKTQEMRSHSLSKKVAKTTFGKSVLTLLEKWSLLVCPAEASTNDEALKAETKQALEQTLSNGLDRMAFSTEHLVNLTMLLWKKSEPRYGPCAETMSWLRETPYFRDYLAKDPAFGDALTQVLPEQELSALQALSAAKVAEKGETKATEGVSPADIEANVSVEH